MDGVSAELMLYCRLSEMNSLKCTLICMCHPDRGLQLLFVHFF